MADNGQDLSEFQTLLKEVWEPSIAEFLNNSNRTASQFDKNSRGVVEGKYIKLGSHIGRNSGFSFLLEGETVADAGHQTHMNEIVNTKKAIGHIKLTSEVVENSSNDTAALAAAMDVEQRGLRNDVSRELNFLLAGSAGNGVIATLGTTTTSNTVVLATSTTQNVLRYIFDQVAAGGQDTGLVVSVGTLSTPGSIATNRHVTAVNVDDKTITIDGAAISTTGADFIFRQGQGGTGASQRVTTSLRQMIDDTTPLYGANPADFPLWKSTVIDAENGAVTEDIFTEAFDVLDQNTGNVYGDVAGLIVTTHAVRRGLSQDMKDRVRYQPLELKAGFKSDITISAGGGMVGVIVDRDITDNTAYLTQPDTISTVVASDWAFVNQQGGPVYYDRTDDCYHMLLRTRREFIINNRRANLRIDNLGTAES